MTVHKRGACSVVSVGSAVVLFLWVLLIVAQLGFIYAVHEETTKLTMTSSSRILPRKIRFLATESSSSFFHAGPSQVDDELSPSSMKHKEGNPDSVYGDDKRIIHTGPNPLHN